MLDDKQVPDSSGRKRETSIEETNREGGKPNEKNQVSLNNPVIPTQRVSLVSEHCIPPAPGPLAGPHVGGFPGNSILLRGQAVSLQLAQLEARLALTHMNNVLAAGLRGQALTSNPLKPHVSTAPPSPTAVAINLLNLLKIANGMSHPMYNPYASGNQGGPQGQYSATGGQSNRDQRIISQHLGTSSNYGPGGASSASSVEKIQSVLNVHGRYGSKNMPVYEEDIEKSVDLHISQAREGARHQSMAQSSLYTHSQRQEVPSSGAGTTSYLSSSSSSHGQRHSDYGGSSLDWLPTYKNVKEDKSPQMYSTSTSGFMGGGDSRYSPAGKERQSSQAIPGLGDYNPAPPTESSRNKYTSESAVNILMNFGLEKEDLEHLISYPESQITPENLPFILREIRIKKNSGASVAAQPKPFSEPQPVRSTARTDPPRKSDRQQVNVDNVTASILKPSKVIDYGHTSKYNEGFEVGKPIGSSASSKSGGIMRMDAFSGESQSKEPIHRSTPEMKSSSVAPPRAQMVPPPPLGSTRSSMAPTSTPSTRQSQTQPSQSVYGTLPPPKKDVDLRNFSTEASRSTLLKPPEAVSKPVSKAQQPTLVRGVHPDRPGLVVLGSSTQSSSDNKSKPPSQGSTFGKPSEKQSTQHQQIPPLMQVQTFKPANQGPPPAVQPRGAKAATAPHQQIPTLVQGVAQTLRAPAPAQQSVVRMETWNLEKSQETPKVFPHVCNICKKLSAHAQDWFCHLSSPLHLASSRVLGIHPQNKDSKQSPAAPVSGQDTRRRSRSTSRSPRRQHRPDDRRERRGSEDRRGRRGSRSRSQSPRHGHTFDSRREKRSSRSRSRSPRRHHESDGRGERRSSRSRSPHSSRHTRRSRSRSGSSRYDRYSSRYRSRSRSQERRSTPRRRDERQSSPARRRSQERRSSPRRSRERRSPRRRSEERQQSPGRSRERSLAQRNRSSSAERLAKKLLEKTSVQSLSTQADLETVVKTLAPALLAELAKMKSGSSSSTPSASTSSSAAKKESTAKGTKVNPRAQKTAASGKTEAESSSSVTVTLEGVIKEISYQDVICCVARYAQPRSVVLFRSKNQAVVYFDTKEEMEKLRKGGRLFVDRYELLVSPEKVADAGKTRTNVTKVQKKPPEPKSTKTSSSTAQTSKPSSSAKPKTQTQTSSEHKKPTPVKVSPKAKAPVSKPKPAPTKQSAKPANAAGKGPTKESDVKKDAAASKKPTAAKPKAPTSDPKSNPEQKNTAKPAGKPPASDAKPAGKPPISESKPAGKPSVSDAKPAGKPPVSELKPAGKPPVSDAKSAGKPPVSDSKPTSKPPVSDSKPAGKPPVSDAKPVTKTAKAQPQAPAGGKQMNPAKTQSAGTEAAKTGIVKTATKVAKAASEVTAAVAETKPAPVTNVKEKTEVKKSESQEVKLAKTEEVNVEGMEVDIPTKSKSEDQQLSSVEAGSSEADTSPSKASTDEPQTPKTVLKTEETQGETLKEPPQSSEPEIHTEVSQQTAESPADEKQLTTPPDTEGTCSEPSQESKEPAPEDKNSMMLPEVGEPSKTSQAAEMTTEQQAEANASPTSAAPHENDKPVTEEHQKEETVETSSQQQPSELPEAAASEPLKTSEEFPTPDKLIEEKTRTEPTTKERDVAPETSVTSTDEGADSAPATSLVESGDDVAEIPPIDEDIFRALTAALRQHKLSKSSKTQSQDKKNSGESSNSKDKFQMKVEGNRARASTPAFFDNQSFNFEDFVTLDEIVEDVDESVPSAVQTSTRAGEKQSKVKSSQAARRTPARSSKSRSKSASPRKQEAKASRTPDKLRSSISDKPAEGQKSHSSSSAVEMPEETPKTRQDETKSSVAESDHEVPTNITSTKIHSKSRVEGSAQTLKDDGKNKDEQMKTDSEHAIEVKDDQVLDTLNTREDKQQGTNETKQFHGDGESHQIPQETKDEDKPNNKTETESLIQMQENCPDNQESNAEDKTLKVHDPQLFSNDETELVGVLDESHSGADACETKGSDEAEEVKKDDETPNESANAKQISKNKEVGRDSDGNSPDATPLDKVSEHSGKGDNHLSRQIPPAEEETMEEEGEVYKVLDAVEEQTTAESEADNMEENTAKVEAVLSGSGRATRRSSRRGKTPSYEPEELPKKRSRRAKKTEIETTMSDVKTEEESEDLSQMVFKVLDALEDEPCRDAQSSEVPDLIIALRAEEEKAPNVTETPEVDEDSQKEEVPVEEPIIPTRSGRARRVASREKTSNKTAEEEETPSRRSTPSRNLRDRTPKTEDKAPPEADSSEKASTEEVAYTVLDDLEDEAVRENSPVVQGKARRGRRGRKNISPRKPAATTKKAPAPVQEPEVEAEYQILDSVDEETLDNTPSMDQAESVKATNSEDERGKAVTAKSPPLDEQKEEQEPLYQILDSVEDDQLQEELNTTDVLNVVEEEDAKEELTKTDEISTPDFVLVAQMTEGGIDGSLSELVGAEGDHVPKESNTEDEKQSAESQSSTATEDKTNATTDPTADQGTLGNFDEVSEEEEDYPDDTAEEEELKKRQNASKERDERREQETVDKESKDQGDEIQEKDQGEGKEEQMDPHELVTLDEVGEDETGEEDAVERQTVDKEFMEMQELVTLDEILGDETVEGEGEEPGEMHLLIQDVRTLAPIQPELSLQDVVDLASGEPNHENQQSLEKGDEETLTSAKRKHEEESEEILTDFTIVDEVGKTEDEEQFLTTPPPGRGRGRKKGRQSTVRKSSRGKSQCMTDDRNTEEPAAQPSESLHPSSTLDKELPASPGNVETEIQKKDKEGTWADADIDANKQELDEQDRAELKVTSKHRREVIESESKRARSQSPVVLDDFQLPPFSPGRPIGQEYVVPKSGYFCNLCSIFYLTEATAKDVHCSSKKHYDNVRKHHEKLQWKSSKGESFQGSVSD